MLYIFDIHSTLFDEHQEYAVALREAIAKFIEVSGKEQFTSNEEEKKFYERIYAELKQAGILFQSDWDTRRFDAEYMPTLVSLFDDVASYKKARDNIIPEFRARSRELMYQHRYPGALELIQQLKDAGHTVYLCTDSNVTCAEDVMEALKLNDIVDGCFCCASPVKEGRDQLEPENTKIHLLLDGMFKPHAGIIGEILTYHARKASTKEEKFSYSLTTPTFTYESAPWAFSKLHLEHPQLKKLQGETIMVGDSWRDILLAKNAGVLSVHAEYGTKSPNLTFSHDVIHAMTYWENALGPDGKEVNRWELLTPMVKKQVQQQNPADFVCRASIKEMAWMVEIESAQQIKASLQEQRKIA